MCLGGLGCSGVSSKEALVVDGSGLLKGLIEEVVWDG